MVNHRYLFGETNWISCLAELPAAIEGLIDRSRNIILVSHDLPNEKYVLQALGFDLETSVVGRLDTFPIGSKLFGSQRGGLGLGKLLERLDSPVEGCHIAGNDANYTIRALILIAVRSYSVLNEINDESVLERLGQIEAIWRSPIPRIPRPPHPLCSRKYRTCTKTG